MNRIEIEKKLNEDRAWLLETYSHLTEDQLFGDLTPSEHDPSNFWSALDHLAHLALIERNFAAMIRRHISGHKNPVGLTTDDSGTIIRELYVYLVREGFVVENNLMLFFTYSNFYQENFIPIVLETSIPDQGKKFNRNFLKNFLYFPI